MAPKPVILLIEDEAAIADAVVYALRTDGFEPERDPKNLVAKHCAEPFQIDDIQSKLQQQHI